MVVKAISFLSVALCLIAVHADEITFENGFSDLQAVDSIATPTNTVGFTLTGGGPAFIAEVGAPITAFVPNDDPLGGYPGSYLLSDGSAGFSLNFFFTFKNPVSSFAFELYDFELEMDRTATLSVYADKEFTQLIATDTTGGIPLDGGVVELSIQDSPTHIRSASLTFNIVDNGMGIDNMRFQTVSILGDINFDGVVDLLDVTPFVDLLASGGFQYEADINGDGSVDLSDVSLFVELLIL